MTNTSSGFMAMNAKFIFPIIPTNVVGTAAFFEMGQRRFLGERLSQKCTTEACFRLFAGKKANFLEGGFIV